MRLLTRRALDHTGCDTPDCGHDHSVPYLSQECHPRTGVEVRYEKAGGCL